MKLWKNLKAQLSEYECALCHAKHKEPIYPPGGFSYGEFMLRNNSNNRLLYLNAMEDPTFLEVSNLVKKNPRLNGLKESEKSEVFQRVVGKAYDSDEGQYGIGTFPMCVVCGSSEVESYKEIIPPEFINIDVPVATSEKWQKLTDEEKKNLIDVWISVSVIDNHKNTQ